MKDFYHKFRNSNSRGEFEIYRVELKDNDFGGIPTNPTRLVIISNQSILYIS